VTARPFCVPERADDAFAGTQNHRPRFCVRDGAVGASAGTQNGRQTYFGGIRIPPSMRITSAFM
jgi:hypothetical protein